MIGAFTRGDAAVVAGFAGIGGLIMDKWHDDR
jgi:hypothetical protein